MPGQRRAGQLVAVAVFGFLALNPPLLSLFDRSERVFGVPVLWFYLFVVWAALIGVVAAMARKSG